MRPFELEGNAQDAPVSRVRLIASVGALFRSVVLEVENDGGNNLKIMLPHAPDLGWHVIGFPAKR